MFLWERHTAELALWRVRSRDRASRGVDLSSARIVLPQIVEVAQVAG